MEEENKKIPEREKKMVGPLFWIVLSIVAFDDILDVILNLTGVGSAVASAISIGISGLSLSYVYLAGASINTRFTLRAVITQVAEFIPFVSLLPFGSIFLILTRLYENDPKVRAAIDAAGSLTAKPKGNTTRTAKNTTPPPIPKNDNVTRIKRGS
jgi:hypothetical protein